MAELFDGKSITHQNLSDWRRTGYQDWLLQQQRLQWFQTLTEQEKEINQHDNSTDTFEAMSNYFIFELGQAITTLREIKNSTDRLNRLETLTREFARLQNAFNWSRRVQLEFAKHNDSDTGVPPVSPELPETNEPVLETEEMPAPETAPHLGAPASRRQSAAGILPAEKHLDPSALPDAPRNSEAQDQRASVPDCGSPLPLSDVNSTAQRSEAEAASTPNLVNSSTPKPLNSQTPSNFGPIPAPAPATPPLLNSQTLNLFNSSTHYWPTRGRRFICIEG
ncbi:MAG TPA: hypothetical protein VHC44_10390 [Verrucomicrobiae bacterium]|nr:hypothetical protein [Verrucomicrobiae bacterium]